MKIGLVHFRVGETDGVSLEMEKWKLVLERSGHDVEYVAGSLGKHNGYKIPLLAYNEQTNLEIRKMAFENLDTNDKNKVKKLILQLSDAIKKELKKIPKFDLLIINNIWSLGYNLSAAIAFYEYCKDNNIKTIGHHHDFYFERDYYSNPTTNFIEELLNTYFPPKDTIHVTINSLAQAELKRRKGMNSMIVPNVFNFDKKSWKKDKYSSLILKKTKIKNNDIVFLQATRIVRRKAIEMAIDSLSEVNKIKNKYYGSTTATGKIINKNSEFVLLLPGLSEEKDYKELLINHANKRKVKLIFASDICSSERSITNGTFSLWDFYTIADFITYPSIKEGFGNQLLEAIFSKKPILIFEYPVYKEDIKKLGLKVVSLGNHANLKNDLFEVSSRIQKQSAMEILNILTSKEKYQKIVNENFQIGKKNYSYNALKKLLDKLIKGAFN